MSQSPTAAGRLRIRWAEFDRITASHGWRTDAERARGLGISHATMSNLRSGNARPGLVVVDACVAEFGHVIYDVFFEREEVAA